MTRYTATAHYPETTLKSQIAGARRIMAVLVLLPVACGAEFIAVGPYEGEVCTGFVIEKCALVQVDAIKKADQLYEIDKQWAAVDEFKEGPSPGIGRCWKTFPEVPKPLPDRKPDFYRYDETGTLVSVDVGSYVTFKCQRTR